MKQPRALQAHQGQKLPRMAPIVPTPSHPSSIVNTSRLHNLVEMTYTCDPAKKTQQLATSSTKARGAKSHAAVLPLSNSTHSSLAVVKAAEPSAKIEPKSKAFDKILADRQKALAPKNADVSSQATEHVDKFCENRFEKLQHRMLAKFEKLQLTLEKKSYRQNPLTPKKRGRPRKLNTTPEINLLTDKKRVSKKIIKKQINKKLKSSPSMVLGS